MARSFADPWVKVVDQPNRGAAVARNRGLQEAQGEFVQFLDADDLLAPDKIEIQIQRLAERTDCVASCRWGRFYTNPQESKFLPEPFWCDMAPIDWLVSRWERSSMMHPAGWLVPRPVLKQAGLWDESLSLDDDGEYFGRVVLASREVLFCDAAVSYYRSGLPGSLSGSKSDKAWDSQFRSVSLGADRLLGLERSTRTQRACSRAFEEFVYSCYPAAPDLQRRAWERVRELGGPFFQPQMGPKMKAVSRIVGWKLAKRFQSLTSRLGKGG